MQTPEEVLSLAAMHGLDVQGNRSITLRSPLTAAVGLGDAAYDRIWVEGNISWWEPADRDALWEFLKTGISDHGIAHIRFDAYPGARSLEIIRDIVYEHRKNAGPEALPDVFEFLRFLAAEGQHPDYRRFVQAYRDRLSAMDPADAVRELEGQHHAFALEEMERIASDAGLECIVPEPSMAMEQWAIFHRQSQATQMHEARQRALRYAFGGPAQPEQHAAAGAAGGDAGAGGANRDYHRNAYPVYLHHRTSPDAVSSMAYAFGLTPAPIRNCRVLELGCGTALSLRMFAYANPESEFVGVDFAEEAIETARASARANGLRNIRLEAMDIMNFGEQDFGEFDYIIAHGVYSWVPEPIRIQILRICERHLTPNGVAFISFNARPGYHVNMMLREAGLRFGRGTESLVERSQAAIRGLQSMDFSDCSIPGLEGLLKIRFEDLEAGNPIQAGFDEFGDINNPQRFSAFAADLKAHGLKYFAESQILEWTGRTFSPPCQQLMSRLESDAVRRMEYRDLIRFCTFHAALVCRATQTPAPAPVPSRLLDMLITTGSTPLSQNPDPRGPRPEKFESPKGARVDVSAPLIKSLLITLYLESPTRLTLREALKRACLLSGEDPAKAMEGVHSWLPTFWETGFIDLYAFPQTATPYSGPFPEAVPLAREQGRLTDRVPSLTGTLIVIDDATEKKLLQLLDGKHPVEQIRAETGLSEVDLARILANWARVGLIVS